MRELTKKVIEAGLVPKQSVRLLQMWRCLPDSIQEDEAAEKTQERLMEFVEEISRLLDEEQTEPDMKETELDLQHIVDHNPHEVIVYPRLGAVAPQELTLNMVVGVTRFGQLVFPVGENHRLQELACRRGTEVAIRGERVRITHVEPRYLGDRVTFYVCDVVPEVEG